MDKFSKIFLTGIIIAIGLSGACAIANNVAQSRHERNLASLEKSVEILKASCIEKNTTGQDAQQGLNNPAKPLYAPNTAAEVAKAELNSPTGCDPRFLLAIDVPLAGIHKDIVGAQHALELEQIYTPVVWPHAIAFFILIVSALPWAWYFLLRRIRELRNAITD